MNNLIYKDSEGFFKCSLLIKLIKTNIKREFNANVEQVSMAQFLGLNIINPEQNMNNN